MEKSGKLGGGRLLGSLEYVAARGDATEATSGPARRRQRRAAKAQSGYKDGAMKRGADAKQLYCPGPSQ